jgi:hypothetical protein
MENVIKNKFPHKLYCKKKLKTCYHNQINHKILQRSWLQQAWTMSSQLKLIKLYDQPWFYKKEITKWNKGFYIVNKT